MSLEYLNQSTGGIDQHDVDDDPTFNVQRSTPEETDISCQKLLSRALKAIYWNYFEIIPRTVGGCASQVDSRHLQATGREFEGYVSP